MRVIVTWRMVGVRVCIVEECMVVVESDRVEMECGCVWVSGVGCGWGGGCIVCWRGWGICGLRMVMGGGGGCVGVCGFEWRDGGVPL